MCNFVNNYIECLVGPLLDNNFDAKLFLNNASKDYDLELYTCKHFDFVPYLLCSASSKNECFKCYPETRYLLVNLKSSINLY